MGTRLVKVQGLGYWMRVFEQNRDLTGYDNQLADIGGQCVMDIDLDDTNLGLIRKAGYAFEAKPSPDNPGMHRLRLKRKWTENYGGGAPTVLRPDNSVWNYDADGLIGNGSSVEAIVQVYDTRNAKIKGMRLEKIRVNELKEYSGSVDFGAPVAAAPAKAAPAAAKETLEDEIPF